MHASIALLALSALGPISGWNFLNRMPLMNGNADPSHVEVNEKAVFYVKIIGSDKDTYWRYHPDSGNYEEAQMDSGDCVFTAPGVASGSLLSFTLTGTVNGVTTYTAKIQALEVVDNDVPYIDKVDTYKIIDSTNWSDMRDGFYTIQVPVRIKNILPIPVEPPAGAG